MTDTPAPDVSIVIVSYNTRSLLARCLEAVRATRGVGYETFVIDNRSPDDSAGMVRRDFPEVRLIANEDNRGFAAGSNQGIHDARGRLVLLLNPDAIVEPGVIQGMVAFLDAHPDVGICGPRILLPDGSIQSCGRVFPTVAWELRQSRTIDWLARRFEGQPASDGSIPATPFDTDWVEGCCLMIRREVIDEIGPLDERYFMYTEELDWCHAAHLAGWRIVALPQFTILHDRGASTRQVRGESLSHLTETRLVYLEKYYGIMRAGLVAAAYACGYLKALARQDAELGRAKLRGVRSWLGKAGRLPRAPGGASPVNVGRRRAMRPAG